MDAFHLSNAQVSEFRKHAGVVFERLYKQLAASHKVDVSKDDDDDDDDDDAPSPYLHPGERIFKNQWEATSYNIPG